MTIKELYGMLAEHGHRGDISNALSSCKMASAWESPVFVHRILAKNGQHAHARCIA